MKKVILILAFITSNIFNLLATSNEVLVVDANNLFDYKKQINLKDIVNEKFEINANSEVLPFLLKEGISSKFFLSKTNDLRIEKFPVGPEEFKTVRLVRFNSVVDANTVIIRHTEKGIIEDKGRNILSFAGKIDGEETSKIVMSYSGSGLFVFIERGDGSRNSIAPIIGDKSGNHLLKIDELQLEENKDLIRMQCLTEEMMNPDEQHFLTEKDTENHKFSNDLLEVKVAVQGAWDYYKLVGNTYEAAYDYIVSTMSVISKIYQDQINVKLYVPYVELFEFVDVDPYANYDGVPSRLQVMPSVWNSISDPGAKSRAVAALYTSLYGQGGNGAYVAGISMGVNTVCRNNAYIVFGIKGGYSYPTLNYNDDVSTAAHELGHAFGSSHTHTCPSWGGYNPPIDSCITRVNYPDLDGCYNVPHVVRPGEIMSYCHLVTPKRDVLMIFHDKVKQRIRTALEKASCVNSVANPFVSILSPNNGGSFLANSNIWLKWTSARVNSISLEYTTDGGTTWVDAFAMLPAGKDSVEWTLPDIFADRVSVRIFDSNNPSVFDTTLNTFSIKKAFVEIVSPYEDGRYANILPLNVQLSSLFVDLVDIELSTDGGETWTSAIKQNPNKTFQLDINGIESENCYLRAFNSMDKKINYISKRFAIGTQSVKILTPNGGEEICIGRQFVVEFISDFVDRLFIEYSQDGGQNWKKIVPFAFNANSGKYNWNVDEGIGEEYLIRVYSVDDRDKILDISDALFIVKDCPTDVNDFSLVNKIALFPNPTNNFVNIRFEDVFPTNKKVTIKLMNLSGEKIAELYEGDSNLLNNSSIDLHLKNTASGSYMIVFDYGVGSISTSIRIIK